MSDNNIFSILKDNFQDAHKGGGGGNGRGGGRKGDGGGPPPPGGPGRKGRRQPGIDTQLFGGNKGRKGRTNTKTLPGITGVQRASLGAFPDMRGNRKGRKS